MVGFRPWHSQSWIGLINNAAPGLGVPKEAVGNYLGRICLPLRKAKIDWQVLMPLPMPSSCQSWWQRRRGSKVGGEGWVVGAELGNVNQDEMHHKRKCFPG